MSHHILMTGGGTLGPVTPLLAVVDEWRRRAPEVRVSWVGTRRGPERLLVEAAKIDFHTLAAPKLDRTRWWKILIIPCLILWSCWQAYRLLKLIQPDIVITAGAYVSVPVIWLAKLQGIPVWVHQLDVVPGLANRLMMWAASKISVTWPESLMSFPAHKTEVVGAMARKFVKVGEAQMARERYTFSTNRPTVLVMGGGTGAATINQLMLILASELLSKANVLHLTGQGKMLESLTQLGDNYVAVEFLNEGMADAYAVADVVVARAGMGTIAELVALGKPVILIPIQGTHQEANAQALAERDAAVVVASPTPQTLLQALEKLLSSQARRDALSNNIRGIFPLNADERIVNDCLALLTPSMKPRL